VAATAVSARPARPAGPAALPARGFETLLLVEDEEMIVRLASGALSALGYRLITAADGSQALDLIARTSARIHLLITDVVMPRMGGRELATRLTAMQPGLRVLFSSGHTSDAIAEEGVRAEEGIDFLQKPYTPALLAKRVREVLDRV
jgi:two-component system, cell cycle sensor histidine kinase and response regulator CckA